MDYSCPAPELVCLSCHHVSVNCKHIKEILDKEKSSDFLVNIKEALNKEMKWRLRNVPQSILKEKKIHLIVLPKTEKETPQTCA